MAVIDVKAVYGTTIKQYYIGASTDTKPTDVQIGAKFLESDTNTTYIFGADKTWVIDPEHQALNKVWNEDTLEWERMGQPLVNVSNSSFYVKIGSLVSLLASVEANQNPLDRYGFMYQETGSATSFYGFQERGGGYYIMRISNGSYLYKRGTSDLDTNWAGRNALSFNSFAGEF